MQVFIPSKPVGRFLLASVVSAIIALLPQTSSSAPLNSKQNKMLNLVTQHQGEYFFHKKTGSVRFIGVPKTSAISISGTSSDQSVAENAIINLRSFAAVFGIQDVNQELHIDKSFVKTDGRSTVRFQQAFNGVPIIGGQLMVNQSSQGALLSLNGEISPKSALSFVTAVY